MDCEGTARRTLTGDILDFRILDRVQTKVSQEVTSYGLKGGSKFIKFDRRRPNFGQIVFDCLPIFARARQVAYIRMFNVDITN